MQALRDVSNGTLGVQQRGTADPKKDRQSEAEGGGNPEKVEQQGNAGGRTQRNLKGIIREERKIHKVSETIGVRLTLKLDVVLPVQRHHLLERFGWLIPNSDPAGVHIPQEDRHHKTHEHQFPSIMKDGLPTQPKAEPAFPPWFFGAIRTHDFENWISPT